MTGFAETIQRATLGSPSLERYEPLILRKAHALSGSRVAHLSSTFCGGGVAEILTPLSLLMNAVGIETAWHLSQGTVTRS
jgi:trehalose synthase